MNVRRVLTAILVGAIVASPDLLFHTGIFIILAAICGYLTLEWDSASAFLDRELPRALSFLPGRTIVTMLPSPREDEAVDYWTNDPDAATVGLSKSADYEDEPIGVNKFERGMFPRPDSDFAALESEGFVQPGADFVMGIDADDQPMRMPKLSSLGFGGMQGSGKTVSMLSIIVQAIAKYNGKIRFLVVDPHMNIDPESEEADNALANKLVSLGPLLLENNGLPNPVPGGDELLAWLDWLEAKFRARLSGEPIDNTLVVVVDEFTSLLDDPVIGPRLLSLLVTINEQARKVGVFALVASPNWKSSRVRGTDLRGSIATFVVHQMPAAVAQQIVPEHAQKAPGMEVGQAILYTKGKATIGYVPFAQPEDLARAVMRYAPMEELVLHHTQQTAPAEPVSTLAPTALHQQVPPEATPMVPAVVPPQSYEPTFADGLFIAENYSALLALKMGERAAITALSIRLYPQDANGEAKVKRALELAETFGL